MKLSLYFSNKGAIDEIIVEPYEVCVEKFNETVQKFINISPTVESVDGFYSEEEQLQWIPALFIAESLPNIDAPDNIHEEFDKFWNISEDKALSEIVTSEHPDREKTRLLIENYLYTKREP